MIDREEAEQLIADGGHLFAAEGSDLGTIVRIYLDEYTGWPGFLTVAAAVAGQELFVALHQAELRTDGVEVPYTRTKIELAPRVANDQNPTIEEEDALFDYYGVPIDGTVSSVTPLGTGHDANSNDKDLTGTPVTAPAHPGYRPHR